MFEVTSNPTSPNSAQAICDLRTTCVDIRTFRINSDNSEREHRRYIGEIEQNSHADDASKSAPTGGHGRCRRRAEPECGGDNMVREIAVGACSWLLTASLSSTQSIHKL